jgi:WD40 repeat protein
MKSTLIKSGTALILLFLIITCAGKETSAIDSIPKIKIVTVSTKSFVQVGTLPGHIQEASGLVKGEQQNFWTHNDDGIPVLFSVDHEGKLIRTLYLNNANNGWEDIARDHESNLYIGAFGNNRNDKKDLKILIIKNPESITEKIYNAEIINFIYEDQTEFPPPLQKRNYDADALIAYNHSLFIFTKNRTKPFTGYTKVYRLPKNPGQHKAILVDSLYLGPGPMMDDWVTGADLSPDGSKLALLGHSTVWIISGFNKDKFSSGKITKIELGNYSHKAGIAFTSENELFIVDEKEFGILGGLMYRLNLAELSIK